MSPTILGPRVRFRSAVLLWLSAWLAPIPVQGGEEGASFDRSIAPLLIRRCLDCHNTTEAKGKLDLTRRASALKGGENGPPIVPNQPDESLLWEKIDGDEMPPKHPLPAAEKAAFKAWIAAGAVWGTDPIDPLQYTSDHRAGRDWWAFQPVTRPSSPAVSDPSWCRNPIDRFILERLDEKGLIPAHPAAKRTLIRRVSFSLIGLPPSPAEVDAFVADERADAYERLVDRLLASPEYGTRWARLWLDLARYGESNGFEHDEFRTNAWPYRDWVVDAFNRDMPYDAFARFQIAGDLLPAAGAGGIEATGFLVAGAYDSVGQTQQSAVMRRVVRQDEFEDIVGTVGQTFLGLTVQCARCHDHKFDPVRQADYYRLTAALGGVRHGEREVPAVGARPAHKTYAVAPRPSEPTFLLLRGNPATPRERVHPGAIDAVAELAADFEVKDDAQEAVGRVKLAEWLTDPRNPLTPRVIVNRLWQAHFGTGLVETPSDFGFNGGRPSHPALLDWLAAELVERGWSLKAIHRLIVTSSVYRQSSRVDASAIDVDAGDRLLWRKAPLRLEAEMVRDAMLDISGVLNRRPGGPGFQEFSVHKAVGTITNQYTPVEASGPEFDRRTLYRSWARGGRNGFLDAFDCPDPSTVAPRRAVTTTPLQALALLNNALTLRLSDRLAERLRAEAGDDPERQVDRAYQLAFGRAPSEAERAEACRVVAAHGAAVLARAIFNSNEFLYVD